MPGQARVIERQIDGSCDAVNRGAIVFRNALATPSTRWRLRGDLAP